MPQSQTVELSQQNNAGTPFFDLTNNSFSGLHNSVLYRSLALLSLKKLRLSCQLRMQRLVRDLLSGT